MLFVQLWKLIFCTHLFASSIYDLGWGRSSIPQQAHPAGGGGAGPSSGEVGNSPAEAGRGWEGCWWEREVTASIQNCCCSVLCTQLTQCNNTRERGSDRWQLRILLLLLLLLLAWLKVVLPYYSTGNVCFMKWHFILILRWIEMLVLYH